MKRNTKEVLKDLFLSMEWIEQRQVNSWRQEVKVMKKAYHYKVTWRFAAMMTLFDWNKLGAINNWSSADTCTYGLSLIKNQWGKTEKYNAHVSVCADFVVVSSAR